MNIAGLSNRLSNKAKRPTSQGSTGSIHLPDVSLLNSRKRILIHISGATYETYESTLDQFPETFLGSKNGRTSIYDPVKNALILDRNRRVFDSILFFYQSNGILAKPDDIPENLFNEELKFYGIEAEKEEEPDHKEISISDSCDDAASRSCEGRFRGKLWESLEHPWTSSFATVWAYVSVAIIIFSVTTFCLETVPDLICTTDKNATVSMYCVPEATWSLIDKIIVAFFTLEYLARLYAAPGRLKFIKSPLAVVDMAAIIPYYITLVFEGARIPSFSVLRLCRVIRLMKLSRYSEGLKLVGKALSDSYKVMGSLMASVLMTVVFYSSVEFYAESTNPGTNFGSITESFWWAIITMTTVGYGDMVPVTLIGKLASSFCAVSGIVLLYILPLPAFVMNFSKRYEASLRKADEDQKKNNMPTITSRRAQRPGERVLRRQDTWMSKK